jgi:hypothetical protein
MRPLLIEGTLAASKTMIFNYLYMSTLSICFLISTSFYSSLNKKTKTIWVLVAVTFVVEWVGFYNQYLSENHRIKPWLYQAFSLIEAILLGCYFSTLLKKKATIKLIYVLSLISIIIFILDILKNRFTTLQNFKYYLLPISFYVLFSILYLSELLNSPLDLNSNPNFWIVVGVLFFYSGFFFLSGFINFIAKNDLELAKKLYTLNHLLNIIYYSLITYGFVCQRRLARW